MLFAHLWKRIVAGICPVRGPSPKACRKEKVEKASSPRATQPFASTMADEDGDEVGIRHVVVVQKIGTEDQACCFTCKTFLSKQGGRWKYIWAAPVGDADKLIWHCDACGVTTSSRPAMQTHVSVHAQPDSKSPDPPIPETLPIIEWIPTNPDKSEWRPASCPTGLVSGGGVPACDIITRGSRKCERVFGITGSTSIVYTRWYCNTHKIFFGPRGEGAEHFMAQIKDEVTVPSVLFVDRTVYSVDFIYYIMSIFFETFCVIKLKRAVHCLWEKCYLTRYREYQRALRAFRSRFPLVTVEDSFPAYTLGDKFQNRNTIMELLCEIWCRFPDMRALYRRDIEIVQRHFTMAMAIDETYLLAKRQRVLQRAIKEGEKNQFWCTSASVFNVMSSITHMVALSVMIPNHSDTTKKKHLCALFRHQNKDRTTKYIAVDNIKAAQDNLIKWHGEVIIDERGIAAKPLTVGADLFHISQLCHRELASTNPDRPVACRALKTVFARIKESHPAAYASKNEYLDAFQEWKTTYERATTTATLCTQSDIAIALTLLKKHGPVHAPHSNSAAAGGAGAAGAEGQDPAADDAVAETRKKRRELEMRWDAEQHMEDALEHRKRNESEIACDKCGSLDFEAEEDCMLICEECFAGIHIRCLPPGRLPPKDTEEYWCELCLQHGAEADRQAQVQQAAKRSRDGAPSSVAGVVTATAWAGITEAALHPTVVQGLFAHRQYRDWLQIPGTNVDENFHMVSNGNVAHNQGFFRPDHLEPLMEMTANKYNISERPNALLRTPKLAEDPYFVGLFDRSVDNAIKDVTMQIACGESTRALLRLCPASVHETYGYDEWVEDNGPVARQLSDRWSVDDMNELQALCDRVAAGEVALTDDEHANFYKYVQAQPAFARRKKQDIQAMMSKMLRTRMESVRDSHPFAIGDLQKLIAEEKASNSGESPFANAHHPAFAWHT